MFLGLLVGAILLAVVVYVTWEYRQGSFPTSRTRKTAKRAARVTRELDREDNRSGQGRGSN